MKKVKIGEIATIIRGVSYKKEQTRKVNENGFVALIRANNINVGQFIYDDLVFVPNSLVSENQYVKAGNIVITMSSGSKAHVGKVALARTDINCSFGAFCANSVKPTNTPVPFLMDLGVQTKEGKVSKSHYDKFRQINRYLEFVRDIMDKLPTDREMTIIDFGCGKSYLTFALYYYINILSGRKARIIGLD